MDNADHLRREIRFEGMLGLLGTDAPRFVASIRYHQYDPTVLEVELLWLGTKAQQMVSAQTLSSLAFVRRDLWLHSHDSSVPPIELRGIHTISCGDNQASIDAAVLNVGLTEGELQEDLPLIVTVELQPSGILTMPGIRRMSYTGEMTLDKMMSGEVSVDTSFGTLQAMTRYEYYSSDAFGNRVSHQIQRASITGRIVIPAHTRMLAAHELMQNQLDDVCLALSLCYRQPVDYYEIKYISDHQDKAERSQPNWLSRRKWFQHATKRRADELINIQALIDGGLQKLIRSIRGCSEYASIARAIRFLSASYYEANLETAYFMAFAAMETVVDVCVAPEERVLLSAAKWKKVQRELCTTIEKLGLGTVTAEMKSKIGELRRATLQSRIENACVRMAPKTDDLWPGQPVSQGVVTAARIGGSDSGTYEE